VKQTRNRGILVVLRGKREKCVGRKSKDFILSTNCPGKGSCLRWFYLNIIYCAMYDQK